MPNRERALRPEDLTRLFVERCNAGDAEGVALLYEDDAVMAYPPGEQTVGRAAIQALWEKVLTSRPQFEPEAPLPRRGFVIEILDPQRPGCPLPRVVGRDPAAKCT